MSVRIATIVFDGITALLLAAIPLYILELRKRWNDRGFVLKRRRRVFFAFVLGVVWLAVFYGSLVEPRLLFTRRYAVRLGDGGGKLVVAVVSDTHFGVFKGRQWADKIVSRVNETEPDVVLLAGDFSANDAGLEALAAFGGFRSRFGTFAVLGNYDYRVGAVDLRRRIESYGVEVLTNESLPLPAAGREVRLIGLDDLWYGSPDWDAALREVPDDALKIVLGHNPDLAPGAEAAGLDLLIAGHTHGGQVRLPVIGPLTRLPVMIGQRFDRGLFDFGPLRLFISPGAGETGARARLFCPPEISLLELDY